MAQVSRRGFKQADLVNILRALRNQTFGAPGLAAGTTATKIKTTNNVGYAINGVRYTKAAADDITVGALGNTAAGKFCKIRVEINSAGTVSYVRGGDAAAQALAPVPTRSPAKATLGIIELPASFTFGTTEFGAAGVAFVDGDPDLSAAALEA